MHRVAVTGAKCKTTAFGHLHLSPLQFFLSPLPTLPDCSSWVSSLRCYLEDPLLRLLLLLWLSVPCLSGDRPAQDDGSLQRIPAWQNCCLLVPSPPASCWEREEVPANNPTPWKPKRKKKIQSAKGSFFGEEWGQICNWRGGNQSGGMVDKDLRSLSSSDSFLLLCLHSPCSLAVSSHFPSRVTNTEQQGQSSQLGRIRFWVWAPFLHLVTRCDLGQVAHHRLLVSLPLKRDVVGRINGLLEKS